MFRAVQGRSGGGVQHWERWCSWRRSCTASGAWASCGRACLCPQTASSGSSRWLPRSFPYSPFLQPTMPPLLPLLHASAHPFVDSPTYTHKQEMAMLRSSGLCDRPCGHGRACACNSSVIDSQVLLVKREFTWPARTMCATSSTSRARWWILLVKRESTYQMMA